jgi:hypothetical protein
VTAVQKVSDRVTPVGVVSGGKRAWRVLFVLALAVGVALRAPLYFANPSLLLDEARLALNIASRDFYELTLPLDYDQTAPLFFLWGAKALALVFGVNEYALRAIPFAAGVAMLPVAYLIVRRVMGHKAAVLATALAAVSPLHLQYVRQVKPYTLDGLVALGLLWLALDWVDAPRSARAWRRLVVAGALAIWLSTPAALVLAGMAPLLWFARGHERPPRAWQLAAGAAWTASFGPAFVWIYKPAADNQYLREFWGGSMLTIWEPGAAARARQAVREFVWQIFGGGSTEPPLKVGDYLAIDGVVLAVLLLAAFGLRRTAREQGWTRALLVVAPVLGAFAASLVGGYPIAGRIMLFAATGVIAAVASGAVGVLEALRPRLRPPAAAFACAALLGLSLPLDLTLATHPLVFEHVRSAVAEYDRQAAFNEPVYVFTAALPAWTFYTTDWGAPDHARLRRMARLGSFGGPAFENARPRSRPLMPLDSVGMTLQLRGTTEIIGAYSGAQWRSGIGNVQFHPDTNWTVHEARRIVAAGRNAGVIWVLVIRTLGLERQLFDEMHLCLSAVFQGRGVLLARFVPPAPGVVCDAYRAPSEEGR